MSTVADSSATPAAGSITFFLLAAAAGAGAANVNYAQPLIGLIAPDIGLPAAWSSLVITLGQLGYIAGLILLVPLGDILENRRLLVILLIGSSVALALAGTATAAWLFMLAAFLFGIGSVVAQIAIPFAASLAAPEQRGRRVGFVVSGLMVGILLARPVASLIAHLLSWHAVFGLAAFIMLVLAGALRTALPVRQPDAQHSYAELVGSLWPLLRDTPLLQRRVAYQATMFGAFTLFWSAVPLLLTGSRFGFDQQGLAWFALAGCASVVVSPLAGRLADGGHGRAATGGAIALAVVGFLLTGLGATIGSVAVLLIGAVVIDGAVAANLVIGQRALFMLDDAVRSRLNALFIAGFFAGGAIGSAVASLLYESGGWHLVALAGIALLAVGLAVFLFQFLKAPAPRPSPGDLN